MPKGDRLISGECACLDGSNSIFVVDQVDQQLLKRCEEMDIHPGGALWGKGEAACSGAILSLEQAAVAPFEEFRTGLIDVRGDLPGQRRRVADATLSEHPQEFVVDTPVADAVCEEVGARPHEGLGVVQIKKVGRHSISVCTNVSCMLCGSDVIVAHIEKKLGIKTGGSTPDGRFYLKQEEECLAACCGAPMMMIDHVYHEDLTPEKVDEILDGLE